MNEYISASDIGKAAFCERSYYLDNEGVGNNQKTIQLMDKGTRAHDYLNQHINDEYTKTNTIKYAVIVVVLLILFIALIAW